VGQKVNPIGFRTGIPGCLKWSSRWFVKKGYADLLFEDIKIRKYIQKEYKHAKLGAIDIERSGDHVKVIIFSAMPGALIGKKGHDIDLMRKNLSKISGKESIEVTIQEIKDSFFCAKVVAKEIADQIERRVSFKKAIKKAAADVMRGGAKGVKIRVAGRLDGAEIARDEWVRIGSVPLHTLRADIDYALVEAKTTYGIIGVKIWICKGEFRVSV
jgi:small subunit ribosomal protein S3